MRALKIYEKFESNLDPVADMGIGMLQVIKDFVKKYDTKKGHPELYREDLHYLLLTCVVAHKHEYVKYLLDHGATTKFQDKDGAAYRADPLGHAIKQNDIEMIDLLVKYGAKVSVSAPSRYDLNHRNHWTWGMHIQTRKHLLKLLDKEEGKIYEKFEQDSDPIADLGIGNFDIKLDDYAKPILQEYHKKYGNQVVAASIKYFNKFKEQIEPIIVGKYLRGRMWEMNGGRWKHDHQIKIVEIRSKNSISFFKNPDRHYAYRYFNVRAANGKSYSLYLHEIYQVGLGPSQKVNEKFTQESDPIHDLGIGISVKRDFDDENKLIDFLIEILPAILKTKTIPKNIIHLPDAAAHHMMNWIYYNILEDYINKYMSVRGYKSSIEDILRRLYDKLTALGCGVSAEEMKAFYKKQNYKSEY